MNDRIDRTLVQIYTPSLQKNFINFRTGGGAFLIKGTGETSVSSLHQDWNVVDENLYQSMCVWCPLIDVDENNGCIQVVAGTHKWFNSLRSINMPSVCINFEDVTGLLKAAPVRRGDAVVFAHNVFHGSLPNLSDKIRPAASVSVLSAEAKTIHYYKVSEELHILDAESFFNDTVHHLLNNEEAQLKVIQKIPFDNSRIVTLDSFKMTYKKRVSPFYRLMRSLKPNI
jgi:ectoine hydroxylase-related dioxygenase (phytanoyl-CoA dioxygenase family)